MSGRCRQYVKGTVNGQKMERRTPPNVPEASVDGRVTELGGRAINPYE